MEKKYYSYIIILFLVIALFYFIVDNKSKADVLNSSNESIKIKLDSMNNLSKEIENLKSTLEEINKTVEFINETARKKEQELIGKDKELKMMNEELTLYETKLLPLYYLPNNYLNITVGSIYAWEDFMPCISIHGQSNCRYRKHIVFDLELINNIGFDLNGLYIPRVNILKEDKVVGSFIPSFQSVKLCSGEDIGAEVDSINLSNGCKLKFQARTWFWGKNRSYEDLPEFEGSIKVQFRFINDVYYTDIYETNETTIGYTS